MGKSGLIVAFISYPPVTLSGCSIVISRIPFKIENNATSYLLIELDGNNKTILSASSMEKNLKKSIEKAGSKVSISKIVGESLAEKIKGAKINKIIFDRNGYKYHGRVKALAEAIRSAEITI